MSPHVVALGIPGEGVHSLTGRSNPAVEGKPESIRSLRELPVLTDAVEKVGGMPPARNNRIIGANFLNRYCVFGAHLESMLLALKILFQQHRPISEQTVCIAAVKTILIFCGARRAIMKHRPAEYRPVAQLRTDQLTRCAFGACQVFALARSGAYSRSIGLIPWFSRLIGSQFSGGTPVGLSAAMWISIPPSAFSLYPAFWPTEYLFSLLGMNQPFFVS
jgi:hypothetical protein